MGLSLNSQAAWTLIDNFDGYDNSVNQKVGGHAADCTSNTWQGVWYGTANAEIQDDATAADNSIACWAAGWRGAETDLSANFSSDFSLADGASATYFFQVMAEGSATDCMIGLSGTVTDIDENNSWQDFAVMPYISGGNLKVYSSNGGDQTIRAMNNGEWYNVWVVVDNSAKTFDLYTSTGAENGVLDYSGLTMGRIIAPVDLAAFGLMNNGSDTVHVDNIYVDFNGTNTTYAIPAPMTMLYSDGFSGDGSASLNGTTPDTTTGGADWSAHASMLDNGYPVNSNDASALLPIALTSNKLYRLTVVLTPGAITADNDWLGFGFNQSAAVSGAGTTPADNTGRFTDIGINGKVWAILRESTTGGSDDVQMFSSVTSGAITTTETDAGFDGLTNHIAVIELSTTNGILAARMLIDDADITAGFQTVSGVALGDINGVGISHNNTTQNGVNFDSFKLEVSYSADIDEDGLPDSWEQQIIDADGGDGIATIYDVDPGADFDGDGFTNQQEYELGLDPTTADADDTDTDGDYLPDLWEFSSFSNLTYNSYDDQDNDGYNNQAERVGGTNPLLDTDHPGFMAPSVAFMRDSVVTNNACLMGGGSYGHAINGVSFQDSILYTFDGYQYTAYYDTVGSVQKVCLARRTVNETAVGEWDIIQTDSEFQNGDESSWDAHNVIAFGICPQDGTLHVAWDHHDAKLRYRRSVVGLCTTNKDAWGQSGMLNPEQNWLTAPGVNATQLGDVTYPQFITTPAGGLVMDRRYVTSGNGDQYLNVYNPATTNWLPQIEFIDRAGTYVGTDAFGTTRTCNERCAYLNGFDFDTNGTIHVTWTWRESASQHGNRDICYAYSPDLGTNWYNNAGDKIADSSLGQKITMNSPGITVVPLNMRQLLINQQAQCVDNDGRVHALMLHRRQEPGYGPELFSAKFSNKFTAYYHYFRDPDTGKWTQRRIPPNDGYEVGSRPCMGYDAKGNVYAAFLYWPAGKFDIPGARLDNTFTGTLVIASASKASQYTDWEVLQVIDDHDFDGEPLLDQPRLLSDNILAVYIQEHDTYVAGNGIPTPLHVYEFAVDIPEPTYTSSIVMSFLGDDTVISAFGQTGSNYQLQVSTDLTLTNGWSSVGPTVGGMNSLIALPAVDGLQNTQSFYKVMSTPVP